MSAAARWARRSLPQITVLFFGLLSIWPLLQTRTTCSDDGIFHIHKALGLEAAIQLGHWFPRWSPHMAHGFGYPLYNFYAPLGSYMLAGLHALGFIYPLALHIAFAMCILLSGMAVFTLVRDWWGPWAGLAAAVVYQTSPYMAFNVLFRGALAETLALVWLPLILWTMDRALRRVSLRWGALAALCFAALIYTHNASALLAAPLILGYAVFVSYEQRRRRQLLGRAAAIMLAGLALSAHFWLPALAERDLVKTDQLLVPPVFTYYTNFLTGAELMAPPVATQPGLINPSPPKALGAVAAALALLGAATVRLRRARADTRQQQIRTSLPLFLFAALSFYLALTVSLTLPLWDALPLLPFVQFPWRMLGVATLCAAALAGAAVRWFEYFNRVWVGATIIAAVAAIGHLSWWYPRYCGEFTEATIGTMLEYEYNTFTVGTSAKGEFLPKTVDYLPEDNSVADALKTGETPTRLRGLPAGATLNILDPDPMDFRATVHTPKAFSAAYQMFYYLGWRVSIDGQPHPLKITSGSGLMQFDIPVGEHELRVYFGVTPLRALASGVTVAAVLTTIAVLLLTSTRPAAREWCHAPAPALLLAVPLGLFAAKMLIARIDNPFHRTSVEVASLGTPLAVSLDNGLNTLAYTVRPLPVPSGGEFEVIMYLSPRSTPQSDYRPLFLLQSAENLIWNLNPHETAPPRWHREPPPTQYWPVGEYGQFARQYRLLPGTPPGDYQLFATFFDYATLETSKAVTPAGVPQTDRIDLGTVTVVRPPTPASVAALEMTIETGSRLTPEITLLGGSTDRHQASPGDLMKVTLFFHAEAAPRSDEHITLGLQGTDFAVRLEPTPGFHTGQWQPGDIWRGQHLLRLPANTPDGEYIWTVRASSEVSDITYLDNLRVTAPERIFEQPNVRHRVRLRFGNDILLSGYDWSQTQARTGDVSEVRLIWRALTTPTEDLSVFIHLESLSGELVAQHDSIPADWSRPTPGWLPGEYVVDLHYLAIPADAQPGAYLLYAGLADRTSGRRLPVTTENAIDDRALLGQFDIAP